MMWMATLLVYAIIGGPGAGKTSIIESLRTKGEVVATEAATRLIKEKQQQNIAHPWEHPDFNLHVSLLQERLEQDAFQRAISANKSRLFVDRGMFDPLAYEELDLSTAPLNAKLLEKYHRLKNRVVSLAENHYEKIFFVLPHTSTKYCVDTNAIRKESTDEALKVGSHILELYKRFVPEEKIVFVPGDLTPQQRASFILSHLQEHSYMTANNFAGR